MQKTQRNAETKKKIRCRNTGCKDSFQRAGPKLTVVARLDEKRTNSKDMDKISGEEVNGNFMAHGTWHMWVQHGIKGN